MLIRCTIGFMAVVSLVLGLCAGQGCAAYTGPKAGSTAEPAAPPPRPAPQEPVYYEHTVKKSEQRQVAAASTEEFSAAYAKRGKPPVAVVLYDASNSIVISPTFTPIVQVDTSVNADASVKTDEEQGTAHVEGQRKSTLSVATGNSATQHQLFSWSEVQQAIFETLRGCGVRLVDPEMVTLSSLDKLLVRTQQGISLHTAELESVRKTGDFQVLFLIQEVREGSDTFLQGRAWDLRDGTFLAATRSRLMGNPDTRGGKMLLEGRARSIAQELLAQAAQVWSTQ